jgi:hypothetical protein
VSPLFLSFSPTPSYGEGREGESHTDDLRKFQI